MPGAVLLWIVTPDVDLSSQCMFDAMAKFNKGRLPTVVVLGNRLQKITSPALKSLGPPNRIVLGGSHRIDVEEEDEYTQLLTDLMNKSHLSALGYHYLNQYVCDPTRAKRVLDKNPFRDGAAVGITAPASQARFFNVQHAMQVGATILLVPKTFSGDPHGSNTFLAYDRMRVVFTTAYKVPAGPPKVEGEEEEGEEGRMSMSDDEEDAPPPSLEVVPPGTFGTIERLDVTSTKTVVTTGYYDRAYWEPRTLTTVVPNQRGTVIVVKLDNGQRVPIANIDLSKKKVDKGEPTERLWPFKPANWMTPKDAEGHTFSKVHVHVSSGSIEWYDFVVAISRVNRWVCLLSSCSVCTCACARIDSY
jgi:hypothetical protein